MATIEATDRRTRAAGYALLGLFAAVALTVLTILLWPGPPQMGGDEEVFATVDALFTAVTARDEKRLGECERRLTGYRDAGRLPADAATALDRIVRTAHSGSWESAAERLYEFMLAQRRDGATGHHHEAKPKATGKAKRKI